jgi:hypothetical protein
MKRIVSLALFVLTIPASRAAAQDVIYRETFGRPELTGNQNLPRWGWQRFNANGAASGTITGGGGVSGDGPGGMPTDLANTESAGPNADGTTGAYVEGWQYMDGTQRLSITTEFAFNPADAAPLTFRWWQGAAYNGTPNINEARIAVRIDGSWFVTSQFFSNIDTPVTAGANFGVTDGSAQGAVPMSYVFDPAPANWLTLNFDGNFDAATMTATGSTLGDITAGAAATSPLNGVITGFGIFRAVTGANMRFDTFTVEGKGLLPGDVDKDDDIDLDDFAAIRDHFQQAVVMREQGDLNGDGFVDWIDFRQWKSNFVPPVAAAGEVVPEPAAGILAILALMASPRLPRKASCRGTKPRWHSETLATPSPRACEP